MEEKQEKEEEVEEEEVEVEVGIRRQKELEKEEEKFASEQILPSSSLLLLETPEERNVVFLKKKSARVCNYKSSKVLQ